MQLGGEAPRIGSKDVLEGDAAVGQICERPAEEQPHAEDREIDLDAALRAIRLNDDVRVVRAGRKAAKLPRFRTVGHLEQSDGRTETNDERNFGARQLPPIERRRPMLPPSDIAANMRANRRMRRGSDHPPAMTLAILEDRQRPAHRAIIRRGRFSSRRAARRWR